MSAPKSPGDAAERGSPGPSNYLRDLITRELREGRVQRLHTRFPPEPNGYLHIGHAKAICLNFGLAEELGGLCNLRFDDTNPETEDMRFVEAAKEDIRWLGFDWGDRLYFTSDYFERLYDCAEELIRRGRAYVDEQDEQAIREGRGDYHRPGRDSPFRDRPAEESLDRFRRMRAGEFAPGACVLRARIDMRSPNMNLRDPILYRIRRGEHYRRGRDWCIYPTYDWAHGLSDAFEGITHSLCSLEFTNHRPLYDWLLEQLDIDPRPRQFEFARLNLSYTVLSKRRLGALVAEGHVSGWDDPRMPTLAGMRRRGVPPAAIRAFCERIGVSRRDGVTDVSLLEHAVREELNRTCPRAMGVLRPLPLVIENFPEGEEIALEAPRHPDDPGLGSRPVYLRREVLVERDDFREEPPRKWHRLAPGREVRLRYGCLVTCTGVEKDARGEVVALRGRWDPGSRGGNAPDGRKVRGTIHWVPAARAVEAEVRLYDRLFLDEDPLARADIHEALNPRSLEVVRGARLEPALAGVRPGERLQLERLGYFCVDPDSARAGRPVLNRTIALRDSWAKIERAQRRGA